MDEFVGCLLSVNCGETLGIYQGRVQSVNAGEQSITLSNPLRNGTNFNVKTVTLNAPDIQDLSVLKLAREFSEDSHFVVKDKPQQNARIRSSKSFSSTKERNVETSPSSKKYTNGFKKSQTPDPPIYNGCYAPTQNNNNNNNNNEYKSRHINNGHRSAEGSGDYHMNRLFGNGNGLRLVNGNANALHRPNSCISPQPISDRVNKRNGHLAKSLTEFDTDFDFEANLKLFDKQMVMRELGEVCPVEKRNYRHDENVIADNSRVYIAPKKINKWICQDTHQQIAMLSERELETIFDYVRQLDSIHVQTLATTLANHTYDVIANTQWINAHNSRLHVISSCDSASVSTASILCNILCQRDVTVSISFETNGSSTPIPQLLHDSVQLITSYDHQTSPQSPLVLIGLLDSLTPPTFAGDPAPPCLFVGIGRPITKCVDNECATAATPVYLKSKQERLMLIGGLPTENYGCSNNDTVYVSEFLSGCNDCVVAPPNKYCEAVKSLFVKNRLIRVKML